MAFDTQKNALQPDCPQFILSEEEWAGYSQKSRLGAGEELWAAAPAARPAF